MPHLRDTLIFVENLLLEKNTLCVSLVPLMGLEALVRSDLVVLPFWYLSILNRFCLFVLLREEHCGCVCVSVGRLVLAALAVCSRSVGRLVVACTSRRPPARAAQTPPPATPDEPASTHTGQHRHRHPPPTYPRLNHHCTWYDSLFHFFSFYQIKIKPSDVLG